MYVNKVISKKADTNESADDENLAKREFDLTNMLGESLSAIPEHLQPLLLTAG